MFKKLGMYSAKELKAFLCCKYATNAFYHNLFNRGNLNEQFKEYNAFQDGQIAISNHIIANIFFLTDKRKRERKSICSTTRGGRGSIRVPADMRGG